MPYSQADLEEAKKLLEIRSPGKVEAAYRQGQMTLKRKIELQRKMNDLQREINIQGGASGEIRDYVQNVAKEWTKTWEAAKSIPAAVGTGEGFNKAVMNTLFHGLMGSLATMSALDIPGNVAERWALAAGAPDGLARAINWAVWIPTNFLSVGTLLKPVNMAVGAGLRGVKGTTKGIGQTVGKGAAEIKDVYQYLKDPVDWAVKNSVALDSPEVKAAVTKAVGGAAKAGEAVNPQAVADEILKRGQEFLVGVAPKVAEQTPEQIAAIQAETVRRGREFLMTPQELEKQGIGELLSYYAERAKRFIRQGVSHEQTATESLNKDILEILSRPSGTPLSAADLHLVGKTYGQVKDSFEQVLGDALPHLEDIAAGNRPDLIAAYKAHLAALSRVAPTFLGGSGEIGRGLEFMKTLQPEAQAGRMYDQIFRDLGEEFLHQGSDAANSAAIGRLAVMSKEGRDKLLAESSKEVPFGGLHTFYKHLLFSNPATHVVNLLGSKMSILANAAEISGASVLPGGGPSMREAAANWAGIASAWRNLPRVYRKAAERTMEEDVWKAGLNVPVSKFSPAGALGLEDDIMSGIAEAGLTRAAAVKQAMAAGITGKAEMRAYVDALLEDPVSYGKLAEGVGDEVQHVLYHDPLSGWGETIAKGIRQGPFDFFMPVVKFPINSLKMARDWTPGLQYLSRRAGAALEAGGEAEARFRSRQTISWMVANAVWDGALEDKIGWGGPRDPEANRVWRMNNTPYHIGGVPMRWLEPFVTPIFFVSDLAHLANQMRPDNVDDAVAAVAISGERAVENNYWLRIMEGITNAVTDVKQASKLSDWGLAASKVALQPLMTLVTAGIVGSPISRRVREMIDPTVKDVRNPWEYFLSQTPYYSLGVRSQLNYSAKPIEIPPTIGSRWLSFFLPPLRPKSGTEDPVGAFLEKHGLTLPDNWKSYGGTYDPERPLSEPSDEKVRINLTGDQSYNWKILSLDGVKDMQGKIWRQRIAELDADPSFDAKKVGAKQDKVNLVYQTFRRRGFKALKERDPAVVQAEQDAKQATQMYRGRIPYTDAPDIEEPPQTEVEYVPQEVPQETPTGEGQ